MPSLTLQEAHALALQLQREGRYVEAELMCRQILTHDPNRPEVFNTLAIIAHQTRRLPESLVLFQRAIELDPALPEPLYNMANVHRDLGDFESAIEAYRKALALRPDFTPAINNLANALKQTGRLDESRAAYERALAIQPNPRIASSLVYGMYFDPRFTAQDIAAGHAKWNATYAEPLANSRIEHVNDRTADRKLRIGYVSPDFRNHPVGRFLLPLLSHHDRERFEIFCYSDVRRPDSTTAQLETCAATWRDTAGIPDEALAAQIRDDRIDILIDLTMHMEGNRLLVFARKPAPVQVTYLAYCGTTGLPAIDYRISDPYLDPPGSDESIYAERTIRLSKTYWCYAPPPEAPDVGPLPMTQNQYVTFGCLNNFSKVTPAAQELWRKILAQTPGSRLILSAHEGAHRARVADLFAEANIDPARIEFTGVLPFADYLAQYNRIDIALDPIPYPGGTTTLDALCMGVPVITLPGSTAVSRAGVSILSNLGMPELIARSPEDYVQIATPLARDLARLVDLRATLRPRLLACPLTDAVAFAKDFESKLRDMWQSWCNGSHV